MDISVKIKLDPLAGRVCIQLASGVLTDVRARTARIMPGAKWVPVPADRAALAIHDENRPLGIHPSIWYGPLPGEGEPETKRSYVVVDVNGKRVPVLAYSTAGAVAHSGITPSKVARVDRKPNWY